MRLHRETTARYTKFAFKRVELTTLKGSLAGFSLGTRLLRLQARRLVHLERDVPTCSSV
jgi:hypothetical protein